MADINDEKYPIKEDWLEYYKVLEGIRRTGVCNMWGASVYLKEFCPELSEEESQEVQSTDKNEQVANDDFYLPDDRLPLLPDGSRDIESVNALDIALIKDCFTRIISEGKVELPIYDFKTKSRKSFAKKLDI